MKKVKKHIIFLVALAGLALVVSVTMATTVLLATDRDDIPDSIILGTLTKLYEPVEFNHRSHVEVTACANCHHHTTGTEMTDPNCMRCHADSGGYEVVSCSGCHAADPFTARELQMLDGRYHFDKPGLKGAYHLSCIRCHLQMQGPIGCTDCHSISEAGKEFFRTDRYEPIRRKLRDQDKN